jgi:hypothetical protein
MRGHLKERSPGKWAIVLPVRDETGRRRRKWYSFRGTRREAERERARLIIGAERSADPLHQIAWLNITEGLMGIYALCLGQRVYLHRANKGRE